MCGLRASNRHPKVAKMSLEERGIYPLRKARPAQRDYQRQDPLCNRGAHKLPDDSILLQFPRCARGHGVSSTRQASALA